MSQENVEILRRAYEALGRRDLDLVLELCDPEIEYELPDGGINAGTFRGRAGLKSLLEGYIDAFDDFRAEPERVLEADDRVVVFLRLSGRGRTSGLAVDLHPAHVWTMHDGKGVRIAVYPRGEGALEAAGLSE